MLYLIRFGEITLKSSRTRKRFTDILLNNLKDALKREKISYKLKREWSRIFIESPDERIKEVLKRIFGIHSFSPVYEIEFKDLDDLLLKSCDHFKEGVKGKTFAVRVKRSGVHPFKSTDVERRLGALLVEYGRVNLTNPDVTCNLEIRDERAYLYYDTIEGPGGLPIGAEGKALSLISGGFDSAVASWLILKRGVALDYIFYNLAGDVHKVQVLSVLKVLVNNWSYGYNPKLYVLDFKPIIKAIRENTPQNYWNLLLKRYFMRAGERILRMTDALALVTGESVGQVSTQTLHNLSVIDESVNVTILRPLAGMDKEEIIELSRKIGTYEASSRSAEYCAIVPKKPVTRASLKRTKELEERIGLSILDDAIERMEVLDLREVKFEGLELPEVEEIPEDAVIIDIRSKEDFDRWHPKGALNLPPEKLLEDASKLERNRTYVIICREGLSSLEVALELKKKGLKAFSLRGGVKKLQKG